MLTCAEDRFGKKADDRNGELLRYRADPAAFGEEILKETYTEDVMGMMASVRDHPVTIAQSANAVGKTHAAARIAVWFYLCFPHAQVYTAAAPPESNLVRLLWGEIMGLVARHPDLFADHAVTRLNIARSAQSFITGVTIPMSGTPAQREARFSGKHAPNLMFIFDEADAIDDSPFKGAESCMSGGHARMLCMFNPRSEQGEVYRMIRDARANVVLLSALSHPNVTGGEDNIPGAVTREVTVRRIQEWCRHVAPKEQMDTECFELPKFLEGAVAKSQSGRSYPPLEPGKYKIVEPAFSYMVLGCYPAQASTKLISKEWISRARTRYDSYVKENGDRPPLYSAAVAGLDVGEFGADSTVLCFRYGGYVPPLIAWGSADPITSADRAGDECRLRDVIRINVDATGVGAGVAPHLQRKGHSASPVKVAASPTERTEMGEFHILRDQLWWSVREWLRADGGAMLPPDELLIEELLTPTYEVKNGKIRIMRKDIMRDLLKRSPDRADALCLTFTPKGFFAGCDLY